MPHLMQCRCGTLRGILMDTAQTNRGVCYCSDCQAFARFLGQSEHVLDPQGGTEIIQTVQENVRFTHGQHALTCMRLTPKGLLRWYANCCNTPIGNTPADWRVSFIGLFHNCLQDPAHSFNDSFGAACMHVNTHAAKGNIKGSKAQTLRGIARFILMVIKVRATGAYKNTPFFQRPSGQPIVQPTILTDKELAQAKVTA